jgi:hypothetical protein
MLPLPIPASFGWSAIFLAVGRSGADRCDG